MSKYDSPGDVRKATNFRCLRCKRVFITPQGLCGHIVKTHHINTHNIRHGIDWQLTAADACAKGGAHVQHA